MSPVGSAGRAATPVPPEALGQAVTRDNDQLQGPVQGRRGTQRVRRPVVADEEAVVLGVQQDVRLAVAPHPPPVEHPLDLPLRVEELVHVRCLVGWIPLVYGIPSCRGGGGGVGEGGTSTGRRVSSTTV